jgi:predicted PhzF superfamily epimerase YddE/YHI9
MSGLDKEQKHLLSIKETNTGHHKVARQAHSTEQISPYSQKNEKLKDPKNLANAFNISFHQLVNNH